MIKKFTFFSGVTSNTTGANILASHSEKFLFFIKSTGVTSGAFVMIQSQSPLNDWHDIDNRQVSGANANSNICVCHSGPSFLTRAVISGYRDGTYSVSAISV